jgi:hypothetical protein
MGRVSRFLFALSLFVTACETSQTPANAGAECSSDANCALGAWTADCCPRCKPFSAPYSEVAAMDERCRSMSPASARCPALECPPHEGPDFISKCVSGRCIVGP